MWSSWTGSIQKPVCRYLLQRYLGQYLLEKITLAQLTIDLYNGTGTIKNVSLDSHALNGLAEQHKLPIEFIEGHIETIAVSVPWSTIMQDSCEIEITGLQITIQPKKRTDNGGSMLDSMFTSMASSMQLAEECLKTSEEIEEDQDDMESHEPLSGLEHCAQTIDAVLSRVKMCFRDTVLRVEKYQRGSDIGVALEFHIKLWRYSDESSQDTREDSHVFDSAFSHKKITLEGVTCHSDIYGFKQYNAKMNASHSEKEDPSEDTEQDNSVLIANFSGRHEIGLQVKTNDSIGGPQISVDCSFGSVIALLSPIQAHIIYKLIDEILNPAVTSSDSIMERRSCKEKPMDSFDFKRVEEELQEQLKPGVIGLQGLTQQQGWSSACYDDSDEEFQPLKTASKMYHSSMSNFMNASVTSMASSMQQSLTESLVSSTVKSSFNYPNSSGNTGGHTSTEKTKFSVSLASAAVILLHEDILTLSSKDTVLPDTLKEMRNFSRNFFQNLSLFGASVKGQKDVEEVRQKMNSSCTRSHHRLIAAPIKIEGLVQGTSNTTETHGHLTLGYFEVVESLRDQKVSTSTPYPECIEVITFPRNFDHGNNSQSVKMDFKVRSYKGRSSSMSDTTLKFRLQECHCEFDMSIVDRINSLLNCRLPYYTEAKSDPVRSQFVASQNQKMQSALKISVKLTSFSLNFRFPIPDLRPIDDVNRIPYWIRNLQNDSILLQLNELEFTTALNSAVEMLEFDSKCHEAKLFYKEYPGETPVLFATALSDDPQLDGSSLRTQGLDWPRLRVWIYPEQSSDSSGESESTDNEGDSIADDYLSRRKKEPSPFSSKRVIHETLSSQEDENSHSACESVIPGDRSEMNEFIEAATKNTLFKVELNLRFVEVSFPSKHLFEEIYNRVGNDLLLWEPSRLKQSVPSGQQVYSKPFTSNSFSMCRSAIKLDHESDSEEEMSAFYTPSAGLSLKSERRVTKNKCLGRGQSEVTFYLTIGNGTGSFYTPLQDVSGNTIPGQKGQVTLNIEQGCLFVVSSYKGDSNLGYLCLSSHKAEMHHSDLIRNKDIHPRFCSELIKTIYPSENGVLTHRSPDSTITDSGDMLSVAIRIEKDSLKNVKTFKLATGILEGTLDHKVYLPNRSWFTQLTDFFDVTDTPVIGYTPSTVLTELHLHLWNCAVDYRPLNISLRCVLTMETFSISSNIAAQTSTSVIRFMSEDAAFYLTTNLASNNLRNDYVCVMDMDFFELCLRLCANRSSTAPRIDLTASSNVLHIRTCSDSFKSLLELLTYYNNDGDLLDPSQQQDKDAEKAPYSPIKESSNEPALITTEEIAERVRRMSVSQTEHVYDLVAEAMQDSPQDSNGNLSYKDARQTKTAACKPYNEIFFTPNENEDDQRSEVELFQHELSLTSTCLPGDPIMESTNGFPIEINQSDEDEEEFCILENDPGVGILPKSGEPEARVLSDEPIRLIENYFSPPIGKMDILKAPKRYPKPVMKYSLKEMSIIWHLYGGEDFGASQSRKSSGKLDDRGSSETLYIDSLKDYPQLYYEQSEVDIAIDALNPGVVFSKTKAFESAWEAYESPKNQRKQLLDGCTSWRRQGGKGRSREVSIEMHLIKIKFVHEMYPENTEQASRQVIVINNVEILDKLRSSQFNKMMHLYTSPSRPKQTHANMVMVKAAHVRPDPQINMEECSLKVSILPLRLNIDQDALLFIYQFFSDLSVKSDLDDEESVTGRLTNPPSHAPSVESLPVMTVNVADGDGPGNSDGEDTSNLLMFNDDPFGMEDSLSTCSKDPSIDSTKPPSPIYFRQVIFSPEVPIRLDYRGKRMDMTHGPLAGILMGLAQLNCSEIRLKRISHPHGILGLDRLAAFLINDWAVDIKKNQLPSLLGGVGPMHSFVQLFQGVRDLLWLPIEQYQKDGRIAKGLQRGVNAFSTSTAMAALELTNKLIQTIQGAAEFTYDMVSPGPSVHQKRRQSSSKKRKRYRQPGDIREGMNNAYNVVREGLGETAQTIVRVASKEHEQKGISGAVGGVLRQIPPTMVRPIIVVAEATSNVLDGFRSQLEPEFKKENEEKWKET